MTIITRCIADCKGFVGAVSDRLSPFGFFICTANCGQPGDCSCVTSKRQLPDRESPVLHSPHRLCSCSLLLPLSRDRRSERRIGGKDRFER